MPRSCSDAFYFHVVYEYLIHMGMDGTARRMLDECDCFGYPVPYLIEMGVSMEEINRLLECFDDEECQDFFKVFELAVPMNVQNSTDCRKLKLGLHVYFAVTGLRHEKDVPNRFGEPADSNAPTGKLCPPEEDPYCPDNCLCPPSYPLSGPSNGPVCEPEPPTKKTCNQTCSCKNPHCMCRSDCANLEERGAMKPRKFGNNIRPDGARQLAHPCMATLLAFLEKDGSELSKEPELLPYFALPFILDPASHPHYEHLFKPPWSSNLRRWLWNFLISHRQASRVPELVLLLPDLHSALTGRTGLDPSSLTGTRISCNPSDHEICTNHVSANMHGCKQRFRQYYPKDSSRTTDTNPKGRKKDILEEESSHERRISDHSVRKPVTFNRYDRDGKDETAGSQMRSSCCSCSRRQDEGRCEPCGAACTMRFRYNQLHTDYHNLLGLAAELTDALENSIRGVNVDLKKTLGNCAALFPELMKPQEEATDERNQRRKSSVSIKTEKVLRTEPARKSVEIEKSPSIRQVSPTNYKINGDPQFENMSLYCTSPMIPLHLIQESEKMKKYIKCELDFVYVRHDLFHGSIKRMLLILQALRWRLTQTDVEQRATAIESYIANDILAIRPDSDKTLSHGIKAVRIIEPHTLLERLLMPCSVRSPHPLQQAAARFINAIASLRKGRNYLVVSPSVVDVHVRSLFEVVMDHISFDMILATLQKLSLRRSQRQLMIEANLVEWLAEQLIKNVGNRNTYWLKYITALLMNLCLHPDARERIVPTASKLLESIVEWMRVTMVEAMPYLTGLIYSLLSHPEINQKAVEISLAFNLEEMTVLQEDPEIRCQLRHILTFHKEQLLSDTPNIPFDINQDVEDGKWVLDLIEDELDATDPVKAGPGDLSGEDLLCRHYAIPENGSCGQTQETRSSGIPIIDIAECQLPLKPHLSFDRETGLPEITPSNEILSSVDAPNTRSKSPTIATRISFMPLTLSIDSRESLSQPGKQSLFSQTYPSYSTLPSGVSQAVVELPKLPCARYQSSPTAQPSEASQTSLPPPKVPFPSPESSPTFPTTPSNEYGRSSTRPSAVSNQVDPRGFQTVDKPGTPCSDTQNEAIHTRASSVGQDFSLSHTKPSFPGNRTPLPQTHLTRRESPVTIGPSPPCPQTPCSQYPCPQYPCPQTPCPQYPCPQYPCPQTPCPCAALETSIAPPRTSLTPSQSEPVNRRTSSRRGETPPSRPKSPCPSSAVTRSITSPRTSIESECTDSATYSYRSTPPSRSKSPCSPCPTSKSRGTEQILSLHLKTSQPRSKTPSLASEVQRSDDSAQDVNLEPPCSKTPCTSENPTIPAPVDELPPPSTPQNTAQSSTFPSKTATPSRLSNASTERPSLGPESARRKSAATPEIPLSSSTRGSAAEPTQFLNSKTTCSEPETELSSSRGPCNPTQSQPCSSRKQSIGRQSASCTSRKPCMVAQPEPSTSRRPSLVARSHPTTPTKSSLTLKTEQSKSATLDRGHSLSGYKTVSYVKHEKMVRCDNPEDIEVIVAVTLGSDKDANEEVPEQCIHKYKKIIKLIKSSKDLHSSQSQTEESIATANAAVNGVSNNVTAAVDSDCTESDRSNRRATSENNVDTEISEENVFISRPRIARTPPPNNCPRAQPKPRRSRSSPDWR